MTVCGMCGSKSGGKERPKSRIQHTGVSLFLELVIPLTKYIVQDSLVLNAMMSIKQKSKSSIHQMPCMHGCGPLRMSYLSCVVSTHRQMLCRSFLIYRMNYSHWYVHSIHNVIQVSAHEPHQSARAARNYIHVLFFTFTINPYSPCAQVMSGVGVSSEEMISALEDQ